MLFLYVVVPIGWRLAPSFFDGTALWTARSCAWGVGGANFLAMGSPAWGVDGSAQALSVIFIKTHSVQAVKFVSGSGKNFKNFFGKKGWEKPLRTDSKTWKISEEKLPIW